MKRCYSTAELAKMWDVSESTIKRWADAGLLKCRKTAGGHRKFDLNDVVEFQNRSGLVGAAAVIEKELSGANGDLTRLLAGADFAELARRYRDAAISGECNYISTLLRRAYLHGLSIATIGEQIIGPAMIDVGEMWRAGRIQVLEEHLATFSTLHGLSDLHSVAVKRGNSKRTALVGCAEGELHHVAASLVHCILKSEGWNVVYLGPHTPLVSFADAINRFAPELICISITMIDHIDRATRDYEKLHRLAAKNNTRVIMGGAALKEAEVRERFRGAAYAATLPDLIALTDRSKRR